MKTTIRKTKKLLSYLLVFAMVLAAVTPLFGENVLAASSITVTEAAGWLESAYAEWKPVDGALGYTVYVKGASESNAAYEQLDTELIRQYSSYWRADAVGLAAGTYVMKIVAVLSNGSTVTTVTDKLTVTAHDRTGFAWVNGTASGAYNEDGTLKEDAVVLYITEDTKDTVTMEVVTSSSGAKTTATGLQNILAAYKKGYETRPLAIRLIGNISDFSTMESGDILIKGSSSSKRLSCGITFEGIGEDATCNGWGLRIANASNVEVRNLGFMNCNSGEGDDVGLQQNNDHVWVHNCDFFYGDAGSDADQVKGDGALDTKTSTYITHSYNHFYDTGKSNLQGMKSESTENYITYHHNWYDHSDSRHPRIRTCTVHIYNNYYDGNAKYGVGVTMGASVFVESNYFRNCPYPMLSSQQGSDIANGAEGTFSGETGGIIKSYNNTIIGAKSYVTYQEDSTQFDAYEVSSANTKVPSSVKTYEGGTTYNNFDTNASLMYDYNAQTPEAAVQTVQNYAGRMNGGDFTWTFDNSVDDSSYAVNTELKAALVAYKTSLKAVGGYEGVVIPEEETTQEETTQESTTQESTTQEATTQEATEETTSAVVVEGKSYVHNFTENDKTSSFFSITGNTSTSKGTVSYNGLTLTKCLKMESSTSVSFTTDAASKLVLVFNSDNSKNIKVDGVQYDLTDGILSMNISAGSHTITKADTANLFYIAVVVEGGKTEVEETTEAEIVTEAPTVEETTAEATTEAPTQKEETQAQVSESYIHNFTENDKTSSFFSITGNTSTSKGTVSYNGLTLTKCLKMESSTSVSFTTGAAAKLVLVFNSDNSSNVKVDGVKYTLTNGVLEMELAAGSHTITKADSANLFYIAVVTETTGETVTEEETTGTPVVSSGDLYVSPNGKSSAAGTKNNPMDLETAIATIKAGNTIWMASGTYNFTSTILIDENNCGASGSYKKISSIDGGDVVISFDGMAEAGSNRGIVLDGDYWYFYDIDICNAGDNGMLLSGNNNIIELCQFYSNHDSGLQISRYNTSANSISEWPSNNLILNCTSYNNKDEATSENADGFAAKLTCGEGNVFDGCIAYCNSDDGWDLYAKPETGSIGVVTIRNCVAFGNGKLTDGSGSANGDMNGFKLGGSNGQCPTPHVVENCIAFNNGACGFTDNGNGGALTMKNCTAANNGVYASKGNYMCYRTSSSATYTNILSYAASVKSSDKFLGKMNNAVYVNSGFYYISSGSFSGSAVKQGTKITISSSDFVSTEIPGYSNGKYATNYHTVFRNADGSINLNGLFEIDSNSSLYDYGVGAAFTD